MQRGRPLVSITPAACVCLALSVFVLPLNWVVSWLMALLVHETCHFLAVLFCGYRVHHIRFTLSGVQMTTDALTSGKEIICALAGPVGGLLLLLLRKWVPVTALCGSMQSVFNLLPLVSLDGGRALRSGLSLFTNTKKANTVCSCIDKIVRIVLFGIGMYVAWKLSWGLLAVLVSVLLLRRHRNVKIPCKPDTLRVQ